MRQANGQYGQVQALSLARHPQPMYNLTVARAHTFFVGAKQWLVHNECGDGWYASTFDSAHDAAQHHFELHGAPWHNIAKYTQAAKSFRNKNIHLAKPWPLNDGTEGVKIVKGN